MDCCCLEHHGYKVRFEPFAWKAVSLHRHGRELEAQALGDGAIQMALQSIVAGQYPLDRMTLADISFHGVPMQVQIMPLNGLVDINMAGLPLLERLFVVAGGLPADVLN